MCIMAQHYILTRDPNFPAVVAWIKTHDITCSVHLNRTRFWLDTTKPYYLEFALRYADSCPFVDLTLDLQTGF